MKTMFLRKINSVLLVAILVFFSGSSPAPFFNKETVLLELVQNSIRYGHYDPKPLDNEFSEEVFEMFLGRLDNQKRFFTSQDVEFLSQYKDQIDEQIENGSYEFLNASINIIEKRIQQTQEFYKESLSNEFKFDGLDSMESDREKLDYVSSERELEKRWKRNLKYSTLVRVFSGLELNKNLEDTAKKSFDQLEQESREKVLENHNEWYNRLNKQERDDWLAAYLDVIVSINDPHTGYFPPKEKEDFDIQMSGRLEGIGARLSQNGDYIKVVDIVAGSACWRQGDLEIGDLIIEVGEGDGETTDLVGMRVDHAVKLIRGKKGTEVRLTVQKVDGSVRIIPIVRDVVQLEQTYARSVFLENNNTTNKIGYIFLPKFYSNFNSRNGRTSAGDVKKELEKLKMDGAEKILIDLRNNGGGSLQEVVKMAGLFVDKGPIVQVKARYGDPYILKDEEPGIVFDGPLVILTNFFSASASEILAAALQDYDRALIIGSNSTYGKGTVQRFIELDKEMDRLSKGNHTDLKPLGSLKMTVQKFYRIDGKSTQLRGVIPDIILPDNYEMIDVGEKDYENALAWDEIASTNYSPLTAGLEEEVRPILENSLSRISLDPYFREVKNNAQYLKDQRELTKIPMDLEGYTLWRQMKKEKSKELKNVANEIEDLKAIPLTSDATKMEMDSIFKSRREKWIKSIQKDHHLYEALNITADLKAENP
jgi:carboxyl-terminal processing protease